MKLNKMQLVEQVAARAHSTDSQAELIVNALIDIVYETLKAGGEVNISGFGKFRVHQTKGSLGVNPRKPTERMARPARNTPKFRAGDAFKAAVN